MKRNFLIWTLVAITLIIGCRRDDDAWKTNILAPLVRTDMGLNDLIDDSLLIVQSDGSYQLSYRYEMEIDSFDDYLVVPDTVKQVTVTLQKLILDDRSYTDTIRLIDIDPNTIFLHGRTTTLPAQDYSDPTDPQEIDVSEEFFKTATFRKGFLDITIHNDLPVEIEDIEMRLSNKVSGEEIIRDNFTNIPPFSSKTKSIDLTGKKVDGIMLAELLHVSTLASNGEVLIDVYKGVRVELSTRDLEPENATAVFPAQDLVTDTQEVVYNFGPASVTEMKIKTGKVIMEVFSTIEEAIILKYKIPFSGYNGDFSKPVDRTFRVPPAAKGQTQVVKQEFPIDDYVVLYKGKDPQVAPFANAVYSELVASIEYSGIERSISLSDSVYVRFGIVDVIPSYAIGDFGSRDVNIVDSVMIKAFKNITGALSLEDVRMGLIVTNGFGIEANLTINSLVSRNNRTGNSVALNYSNLIGTTNLIKRATNPPFTPFESAWVINKSNSNIKPFLENLPDMLYADFHVVSRPYGSNDYQDFVFGTSTMKATIYLDMPVKFGTSGLTLEQKKDFDIREIRDFDRVSSGVFTLLVDNQFPLSAGITLEFLDNNDNILLSLFDGQIVDAADLVPGEDTTVGPKLSKITADVSEQEMDRIRECTRIRIRAGFASPDSNRHAIYSTYRLRTRLIGDFEYEQRL